MVTYKEHEYLRNEVVFVPKSNKNMTFISVAMAIIVELVQFLCLWT